MIQGDRKSTWRIRLESRVTQGQLDSLLSEARARIRRDGEIRVILDMTEFAGYDSAISCDDLLTARTTLDGIQRLAIVGPKKWHKRGARFFRRLTGATCRCFEADAVNEARAWLNAAGDARLHVSEAELRIARDIQQGLLPREAPNLPGFDIGGASFPVDAVGGDYFDYIQMPDGCWGIVLADVSGHDLGASIYMAETRAYVRALAETHADISVLISHLNHFLVQDTDDGRFVTMFFLRIDPTTRSISFCAEGHNGYLLDAAAQTTTLSRTNMVLGITEDVEIHSSGERRLEDGDIVLLVSDGIEEAFSADGELFGHNRALETVASKRDKSVAEIVQAVYKAARAFSDDAPQVDDMTIVVVKAEARAEQSAHTTV